MTSLRPRVKEALARALADCSLDETVGRLSFSHRKGSLLYKHKCDGLVQEMEFHFDMRPRYEPNAIAHVLPLIRLESKDLIPIVTVMTNRHRDAVMFSGSGLILQNQVNNLAPMGKRSEYWYIYDLDRAGECVMRMKGFIEAWVIPFFEKYTSLKALVEGYEQHDDRVQPDQSRLIYIVACYILLGEPRKALELLERRFGGYPVLRREYSQAFEYVSSLLE